MDHNYLHFAPIEQNDVIVVLGATAGDFIKERRSDILEKNAFVVNVEPTLEGVQQLSSYIKSNMPSNACVISCAVSDKREVVNMDIRHNLITSTLESRPETNERWYMPLLYKQVTPVMLLDDIIDIVGGKVDKLFADIEGSELEMISGSKKIFEIPYIAIAAYHLRDGVETHVTMRSIFEDKGYTVSVTGDASTYNKNEVVLFAKRD